MLTSPSGMATSPRPNNNAPPVGVRRSFTLPTTLQPSNDRQNQGSKEVEQQTIETLYAHSNARIVHFTTGKAAGVGASPRQSGFPAQKHQDVPGNLPWRSSSETTLAVGSFRIYRVPGSVAFLNAGKNFLKPVLAKSQCWCVDGEGIFVLKRGPHDFYRIELPQQSEDDKTAADDFRQALDHILLFEKTPCPFQRDFDIDLPDSPSVTYVPWKPKHRPISPIRRQSYDAPLDAGLDNGLSRRSLSRAGRSQSRASSQSSERGNDATSMERRPVSSYGHGPVTVQGKPVGPTIGKFEVLDKTHQRDQIMRGRQESTSMSNGRSVHKQVPADFDSAPQLVVGRKRSPQKLRHTGSSHVSRNITAPAAVTIESFNRSSYQNNAIQASAREAPREDEQKSVTPQIARNSGEDAPMMFNDPDFRGDQRIISDSDDAGLNHLPSSIPNGNVRLASDVTPIRKHSDDEASEIPAPDETAAVELPREVVEAPRIAASEEPHIGRLAREEVQALKLLAVEAPPQFIPLGEEASPPRTAASEVPSAVISPEESPTSSPLTDEPQGPEHAAAERPARAIPRGEGTVSPQLEAPEVLSAVKTLEEDAGATTLQSPLASLPDFGVDMSEDIHLSDYTSKIVEQKLSLEQPAKTTSLGAESQIAIPPPSAAEEDLPPDTPVWHSAADLIASSSDESQHSTSTLDTFVTAPTFTPPRTSTQTADPLDPASTRSRSSSRNLKPREQQRHRSRSPMTLTRNMYVSHQDSYEHIGAVIGEKMAGMLIGPPLQLAALMLRIASQFTNGARIRDNSGHGWARRGEKGRRLPGTWESYSEDEGDVGSEWEDDYGISIYGLETRRKSAANGKSVEEE